MALQKEIKMVPDFRLSPRIDQVGVEERVSRFTKRSIKKESKVAGLKMALTPGGKLVNCTSPGVLPAAPMLNA